MSSDGASFQSATASDKASMLVKVVESLEGDEIEEDGSVTGL